MGRIAVEDLADAAEAGIEQVMADRLQQGERPQAGFLGAVQANAGQPQFVQQLVEWQPDNGRDGCYWITDYIGTCGGAGESELSLFPGEAPVLQT